MKNRSVMCFLFCFCSLHAFANDLPRCYIIINQQECSSCFNSIPYLQHIDTALKPTLLLRKADERKFSSIRKHVLRDSWPLEKTIFSDSLFQALNLNDVSSVLINDSKGKTLMSIYLKELPQYIDSINSFAYASLLFEEFLLPDSIQLSDFVTISAAGNYYFILDNAFGSLYRLHNPQDKNTGSILKITVEDLSLPELYRAKTNDTAGYAGFMRVVRKMEQFKLKPYEFNNIWQDEDTLYLLMTLRLPKPGERGYVITGSHFLLKITPDFKIKYFYIDPDLNSPDCVFDQVNGFCRLNDHFIFSVFADTSAVEEYIAADFTMGNNGRLNGKLLPFLKPDYFRETGLGNNYTEFSVSGSCGFYRILPLIYDFSLMKLVAVKTSLPGTDFSNLLKARLNFYVYGLSETLLYYKMVILENEKLNILIIEKQDGNVILRKELPQLNFREMNSHIAFDKMGALLFVNSEKNKIIRCIPVD